MDLDRSYTDSTDYNLEDWANDGSTGGEGIIGEKIYEGDILLPSGDTAGGVPGTSTNADLNQYVNEDGRRMGKARSSTSPEIKNTWWMRRISRWSTCRAQ